MSDSISLLYSRRNWKVWSTLSRTRYQKRRVSGTIILHRISKVLQTFSIARSSRRARGQSSWQISQGGWILLWHLVSLEFTFSNTIKEYSKFSYLYSGKFLPNVYRLKKHHDAHHRQIKCKVCGEYYPGNLFTKSSRECNKYSMHCLRFLENECFRHHWRVCTPRIS